ncbi:heavy metal translocating P-type ATPase [Phenylobacterium sp. 58.2.17]|uniref:heavy metal translocating P-type ATPase n=1 Tax=Phenylobacterium sp. 58.2.17 TaxID=2969306 RepID=UPI002264E2A0|nr:heavy metal translocating P-type ATPase [Phenylobacterium sp. 58.2.17]MCX7586508.1 heavy metal translocating P-type ATPase [Phenylobacterium sp. 58.2.17]
MTTALKLRVDGMDCGACATKIENALKRLPGVSDIDVNYGLQRLTLAYDADRTSPSTIRERIRTLGYTPGDDGTAAAAVGAPSDEVWWRSRKAQLAIASGLALATAFVIDRLAPGWTVWVYALATLVGLAPIARRAAVGSLSGTPFSIETLMSVAAAGAIAIGEAEEAAVVVFLFAVGELLEGVAASKARAGIRALVDLVPRTALRERDGVAEQVAAADLAVGDIVIVRPGDRAPSDGEVISGTSEVNQAPVTGESVPVAKGPGAEIYAGTINGNGQLRIAITKAAADNTIARIIHLVEEAQSARAPMARFIDRFSAWYTPAAMAAAGLIIVLPPLVAGAEWHTWIYRGLAVLLIACPCALVISTPAAIASGLAAGARKGLLVKGGAALETLGKVTTVAFDKTGTLTVGRPQVTDVVAFDGEENDLLAKAAAVERGSNHPLGLAIIARAEGQGLAIPLAYGVTATPGKAITGRLRTGFVSVGSPRFAAEQATLTAEQTAALQALEDAGKTVVVVLEGKRPLGAVALRDEPRPDAVEGLAQLRAMGLRTVMLTGDNARAARAIGETLQIEVEAELLPDAKLSRIQDLRAHGLIAMIGDGINDAPALAAASVGVSMGGGTDVALETADAALLNDKVTGVADLVRLSRGTLRNIWQNVAIALGLKAMFLGTTIVGATPLWMAILADTGATVLVTTNALRLLRFERTAKTGV